MGRPGLNSFQEDLSELRIRADQHMPPRFVLSLELFIVIATSHDLASLCEYQNETSGLQDSDFQPNRFNLLLKG